ncbi:P-loop containing nucleoside triphosphate hydrolase protein [Violaceomyces palustris]|uniref:P-loop containing nucleoside triphosphate hydrolase protein n=1 Tax=Violaceomyces palustris TaxID=1673888 RepID=A0ACD0NSG7_9BASI|nr:P-loop containing nucleoside triphosphate hydrolase protein [Violaceomyces palustris]
MANQEVEVFLSKIPKSILDLTKVLKTYPKVEASLESFARQVSEAGGDETRLGACRDRLERDLRPLLTDAGCGRKAALEILEACFKVEPRNEGASNVYTHEKGHDPSSDGEVKQKGTEESKGVKAGVVMDGGKNEGSNKNRPSELNVSTSTSPLPLVTVKKGKKDKASSRNKASEESVAGTPTRLTSELGAKINLIHATSQESRFHVDATETDSLEIDLKDVNISLGQNELLVGAHLRLKHGVHYGLVGRNGTGKSTLLTALGEKLIPGLSKSIKILLVSQISTSLQASSDSSIASVLDVVIRSDRERTRAEEEFNALSRVLEAKELSERDLRRVVLEMEFKRSQDELEEARKISAKRSGTRGSEARKELIKAEAALEVSRKRLESCLEEGAGGSTPPDPPPGTATWADEAAKLLTEAQGVLESVQASTTEARARKILRGLGFEEEMIKGPYSALSGGWRSRASLASALLQPAHLLLLDEPVNYLDLPAVLFVQNFVKQIDHTVVVVSHDREFLDEVAEELIILGRRAKQLDYHDGNLTSFERERRKKWKFDMKVKETLDRKKEKMQKSIQEAAKVAKKTGDENKLRMVKSRQRKLDDRWGLDVNAKGHKFKLNRDLVGYHLTARSEHQVEAVEKEIRFSFPEPEELRFPGSLVHMENVWYSYDGSKKPTIKKVNLTIRPGERVALVGPNGHGKTTLLKLMVGNLSPSQGKVERHPRSTISIYAQHTIERLLEDCKSSERDGTISKGETALSHFLSSTSTPSSRVSEGEARAFLGQLGLKGRTADALPLTSLSGGQLVRLGLAEVMWKAPDLVILDEVTTHLDSETIEGLVEALRWYGGAVVLVSHDRYAVKRIVEGWSDEDEDEDEDEADGFGGGDGGEEEGGASSTAVGPGRVYLVERGRMKLLEKGMDEYTDQVIQGLEP